jgi:DNA-binding XRE family transcriptional regulator
VATVLAHELRETALIPQLADSCPGVVPADAMIVNWLIASGHWPWDNTAMTYGDSIGRRIATYRRRRGLSQAALAGLIGRSESWPSQVERGVRSVDRMSVLLDLVNG